MWIYDSELYVFTKWNNCPRRLLPPRSFTIIFQDGWWWGRAWCVMVVAWSTFGVSPLRVYATLPPKKAIFQVGVSTDDLKSQTFTWNYLTRISSHSPPPSSLWLCRFGGNCLQKPAEIPISSTGFPGFGPEGGHCKFKVTKDPWSVHQG